MVIQSAITELHPVVVEEQHGHREMAAPTLVVLVLPGKS
jgi:hypothetical protein